MEALKRRHASCINIIFSAETKKTINVENGESLIEKLFSTKLLHIVASASWRSYCCISINWSSRLWLGRCRTLTLSIFCRAAAGGEAASVDPLSVAGFHLQCFRGGAPLAPCWVEPGRAEARPGPARYHGHILSSACSQARGTGTNWTGLTGLGNMILNSNWLLRVKLIVSTHLWLNRLLKRYFLVLTGFAFVQFLLFNKKPGLWFSLYSIFVVFRHFTYFLM